MYIYFIYLLMRDEIGRDAKKQKLYSLGFFLSTNTGKEARNLEKNVKINNKIPSNAENQ